MLCMQSCSIPHVNKLYCQSVHQLHLTLAVKLIIHCAVITCLDHHNYVLSAVTIYTIILCTGLLGDGQMVQEDETCEFLNYIVGVIYVSMYLNKKSKTNTQFLTKTFCAVLCSFCLQFNSQAQPNGIGCV